MGLEDLDGIDLAGAQRRLVLVHRAVAHAIEAGEIEAGTPQVVGETDPGRRHLRDGGELEGAEVGELELRVWPGANDEKRIARHDVAKAHEVGARFLVVDHHDA